MVWGHGFLKAFCLLLSETKDFLFSEFKTRFEIGFALAYAFAFLNVEFECDLGYSEF